MSTKLNTNLNAVELTQVELDSVVGGGGRGVDAGAVAQLTKSLAEAAQAALDAIANAAPLSNENKGKAAGAIANSFWPGVSGKGGRGFGF